MSEPIKTGGPAFPSIAIEQRGDPAYCQPTQVYGTGMTLRDHFAGQALSGLLAYSNVNPAHGNYHENCTPEQAAEAAYRYADAMLKRRCIQ